MNGDEMEENQKQNNVDEFFFGKKREGGKIKIEKREKKVR